MKKKGGRERGKREKKGKINIKKRKRAFERYATEKGN
jgi:hypothetical protein